MRFADDADIGAVADRLREAGLPFAAVGGDGSLDEFNRRFGAVRYRRVIGGPPAAAAVAPARIDRAAARAERLARRRAFEERAAAARERNPRRAARAPAGARVPSLDHLFAVELGTAADVAAAAEAFAGNAAVVYAVPDELMAAYTAPDDPYYSSRGSWGQDYDDQWALRKLQPEPAWEVAQGEGVVVAVIDTGADLAHEDLAANLLRDGGGAVVGYDFSDGDADPTDADGHGTHVAGTIAAVAGNGAGIAGVAPRARIMPVKIFPDAYDSVAVQALAWAADQGADILNNSWGPRGRRPANPALAEAVEYAHALGCIVVFAAGNADDDVSFYAPANHPQVIAVASTDRLDRKSDFSNHGAGVWVSAPGGDSAAAGGTREHINVLSLRASGTDMAGDGSCTVGRRYFRARGTSMAAPHVAGLAALVISAHPDWSNRLVAGQLLGTADAIDAQNPGYPDASARAASTRRGHCAEEPRPLLRHAGTRVLDDRPGNARVDGRLDPGERAGIALTLRNLWGPAAGLQARLASDDARVVVEKETAGFGDGATGADLANDADPFVIAVGAGVPRAPCSPSSSS